MKATNNNTTAKNNERILVTLVAAIALASTFSLARAQSANADFAAGRLLIKMRQGNTAMRSATPLPGIASMRPLDPTAASARSADTATWFVAELDDSTDVASALDALANRSDVEFVEPDYIARVPEAEADAATGSSMTDPGADEQYALSKIQAEAAWQINGGSPSIIVALVDTGVQQDHPDLQEQLWHNSRETLNGIDDDGNGMVDDVAGWNFVNNSNDPEDDADHGTHVAGIVGAVRDNQLGVAGAADVTLMPVKVLGSDMSGPVSGVIEGVRYAMNNGANVINLSLSIPEASQAFQDVVNEAAQRDIVIVAAAGNKGVNTVEFPAAFDNVIAVGATDSNDNLADFSNAGPGIELVAPGVAILSTLPGSQYGEMDGTSMAAPYVSAVAALIRSADPSLTAAQVRDRLDSTADDLGDNGYDELFGNGRINAARALGASEPTTPTPNSGNDDQFEDNDTHEAAKQIQAGQYDLVCNDDDWFTMSAPGYFSVEIDGDEGDLDLFVFEADGTLIASAESDGSYEFVEGTSNSGTIFIAVTPYEGQTGSYTMFVDGDGMDSIDNTGNEGDTFGNDPIDNLDNLDGITLDPTNGTLVVPVTCGVGAVQMMAAMLIGCIGLGAATRRKRTRRFVQNRDR